jgi:nicotinate-nucleotide pyrophosphorylase (carboxylating)
VKPLPGDILPDLNTLPLAELFLELTRDGCLTRLCQAAMDEDLGPGGVPGDVTSVVSLDPAAISTARLVARKPGTIAGTRCIPELLRCFAPGARFELHIEDAGRVEPGDAVATFVGPARELLQAERTVLNLLGRLSGVATLTRKFVDAVSGVVRSRPLELLDTRKTTPGLRNLEKYAVRCGGGHAHRIGLYDAVLIKDNHLAGISERELAGAVRAAAERARALVSGRGLRFIEVEVDRLTQLDAILSVGGCGVDIVLLDNMTPAEITEAVAKRDRAQSSIKLEASGGVTLATIRELAATDVDRISVGAMTHQAVVLDLGLDI